MILRSLALLLVLATGASAQTDDWTLAQRKVVAELPGGAEFIEREAQLEGDSVRVQGVFFSEKSAEFAVIDNAPPDQRSLGEAMQEAGAIAGVNGGYFHEDNRPVGLQISAGKEIHGFERAKLLSGVFVVTGKRPRLLRSSAFKPSKNNSHALQAGPFLVDEGQPVAGLNTERRARRTVIATDGSGRWAVLLFSSATLSETARILASDTIFADFPVARALNLDGGSSSALWVDAGDKPFYLRELGRVRNFLAVIPR